MDNPEDQEKGVAFFSILFASVAVVSFITYFLQVRGYTFFHFEEQKKVYIPIFREAWEIWNYASKRSTRSTTTNE